METVFLSLRVSAGLLDFNEILGRGAPRYRRGNSRFLEVIRVFWRTPTGITALNLHWIGGDSD